ncbi:MAG: phosphate signaling complex protein PhoU [Flavobacteriaceae bacterium]|jgi:phosphate transport system protein|nr:phosphate signaling complex protein PhoU [Flavobacteriaceae bacterium]
MSTKIKIKQLEILLNDFELISKTVLTQIQITTKLLEDNFIEELYEEVRENEIIIDRLEMKIREEVVFTIFTFNPLAADLRRIFAYQDITTNLERVGDILLNIVNFLRESNLNDPQVQEFKKELYKMMKIVNEMIRNALISFSTQDSILAYRIIKEDKKVNQLFHKINVNLQEVFSGKNLMKEDIENILNIDSINQNLERIGDSATNIAEATVYLTEGKDIRHKIK